ncbi:Zn-ribbon domain-containing OB-fold protein [Kineosporia babensis]|uniref:OB-fold domain-containing protein n=1 Tax=Kineosporia babensis TaxID=499548 RepID=A0A9X1SWW4_9ACTN|nr:OB-fold domain-containing protein [Kineosporia babensis]MCD5314470.1 OB-fold domain-containing protein [Kineosporia babensis]
MYLKPLPTPATHVFWDGLRRREFLVPRCNDCGRYGWIPYPACRKCQSENLEWVAVSGRATIYSYTLVHRGAGAFAADVPYAIVAAALVEDPTACVVLANTTGIAPEDLHIGMEVSIAFEDIPGEDITLWRVTS